MKKGIRGEREVGGDGVCGCSFGEPLKQVISIKMHVHFCSSIKVCF
jgi:hypothetical protein